MLHRLIVMLVLIAPCLHAGAGNGPAESTELLPATPASTGLIDPTNSATDATVLSTNSDTTAGRRPPAVESSQRPGSILGGLQLRTGLRLQLAAREPDVVSPVALAFDARGRLFVAEHDDELGGGRIKLLEDKDGDGVFEKAGVYADQLSFPSAILCYGEGLFVATGSQIVFLSDTNADDVADSNREVYAGFAASGGSRDPKITQLIWGVDNWVHAACDGIGGEIVCTAMQTAQPLNISGYDFMFNPRTLDMRVEAGGTTRGLGFDSAGRRYTSSWEQPIQFTLTQPWLAAQNPLYEWPRLMIGLSPANGTLYPLRAAASREAAIGEVLASRYATNQFARPTSLLIYRGGSLPKSFEPSVFITDPELRIVSCFQLGGNGTAPVLMRSSQDRTTEFLAARDPAFRPVQIIAAPDGTLCIADLSRSNLDKFEQRGRIWRLLPAEANPAKAPDLSALPSPALIELLGSGNGWIQDTAARLLFERLEVETLRAADKELRSNLNPASRVRLLYLLAANNVLPESSLLRALGDKDDSVRENAVRLAAWYVQNGQCSPALLAQLSLNAKDVSPRVRFHLALTLAGIRHPSVAGMLSTSLSMAPADPLLQSAVLTGAGADAAGVFLTLLGDSNVRQIPAGWGLLRGLASMAGTQGFIDVDTLYVRLHSVSLDEIERLTLACDVGDALNAGGRSFFGDGTTNQWRGYGMRMIRVAVGNYAPSLRAEALRFLAVSGFTMDEVGDWIIALLVPGEPIEVQLAAVNALAHFPHPSVTTSFAQRWPRLSARVQSEIVARMLEQFDRTRDLMSALELGQIPPAALTEAQVNFLRFHRDATTSARARRLFGPLLRPEGKPNFSAVLGLKGSASTGQRVYQQLCSGCHQYRDMGREVGPRLDGLGGRSAEQLLSDILEPHRTIAPGYEAQVVRRSNNQVLYGLVRKSGNDFVTLLLPDGQRTTLPRTAIEDITPQEWSVMPANTTVGLSFKDLASLVAFLKSGQAESRP